MRCGNVRPDGDEQRGFLEIPERVKSKDICFFCATE